jgi:hypothetical protein
MPRLIELMLTTTDPAKENFTPRRGVVDLDDVWFVEDRNGKTNLVTRLTWPEMVDTGDRSLRMFNISSILEVDMPYDEFVRQYMPEVPRLQ